MRQVLSSDCDVTTAQNLLENIDDAAVYNDNQFFMLAAPRSSFHSAILEATSIKHKRLVLCRQNKFVSTSGSQTGRRDALVRRETLPGAP